MKVKQIYYQEIVKISSTFLMNVLHIAFCGLAKLQICFLSPRPAI